MRILHHCSFSEGGLARYAQEQRKALSLIGQIDCAPLAVKAKRARPLFPGKLGRGVSFVQNTLNEQKYIAMETIRVKPDWLFLSSWSEYLAPFWSHRLKKVRQNGTRIAALVHDPVRDFVQGPDWFHQVSIRAAYSFIDLVFLHDASKISWGGFRNTPPVVEIPHGPYSVSCGAKIQSELKTGLQIPEDAFALLAFGHIRDGKNLELLLQAMKKYSKVYLIIAGKEQSSGQRPVTEYKQIARDLEVADRCRWHTGYIPEDKIWEHFTACDAVALTYSSDFRSASGVLNVNAQFKKPVLVSCGPSPLKKVVQKYHLGPWVEPDSSTEIERGLEQLVSRPRWPGAEWEAYIKDHSWEENARRVVEAMEHFDPEN